ncbi:MAG: succinate dehydrogenase/fumarate reductase iron-sulfur subunit [Elusimicrobia bacterium]|nr:succinate dehydrogenase/fumarate reductase iron-sulfur subunit [Elusimicrobiota bacterium]
MKLTLKIWRQKGPGAPGELRSYGVQDISPDMSFLEMLDVLNEQLIKLGEDPVAFDHDCREGICGMCSLVIDGRAHGKDSGKTSCDMRMRGYQDGDTIAIEPFRAKGFPVVKDLVVDRSAFDRIMQAGGYVSVNAGSAPEAHSLPVPYEKAEAAMDHAACIGCGACVAACPNASAMLFVSAKVSQLALLPQGGPERARRALSMLEQHDKEGFGNCTNEGECEKVCPKSVKISSIARLNREFLRASVLY